MKNKLTLMLIAALFLATILAAAWHLNTRTDSKHLILDIPGERVTLAVNTLSLSSVQGEIRNARGETRSVDGQGISLADLIAKCDAAFEKITVVASDEYRAELTAEDLSRAYMLRESDSWQLIVFGDPDSRRCVSNVIQVIVR